MITLFLLTILVIAIICISIAVLAGAATLVPALLIFFGEIWLEVLKFVFGVAGSILLFVVVIACGMIALAPA